MVVELVDEADAFEADLAVGDEQLFVQALDGFAVSATQPVAEIATHLAKGLKRTLAVNAVTKIKDTPSLKSVHDADSRRELLEGAFRVDVSAVVGKGVLLIDDLYRSGATANSVALSLISAGASRVYFLAATRTRSNT